MSAPDKVIEWDPAHGRAVTRDATPAEQADLDARRAAPPAVPMTVEARLARIEKTLGLA
jgi:hypothetical protein